MHGAGFDCGGRPVARMIGWRAGMSGGFIDVGRIEWASAARILGGVVGLGLFVGALLRIGMEFGLFGGLTEPPSEDFVDRILTIYADVTNRWPIEFTALIAFAIAFAGLAALGPVLGRLASPADARGGFVMVAFLGLGGMGLASQLLQIGAMPFLTSPELCECGLREHEIMAREVVINTIFGVQLWLVVGALVLAVPGLILAGSLGVEAGMPPAWRWLSLLIALASLVLAVLAVLEAYPYDLAVLALSSGVLFPIWAIWLGTRARELWGSAAVEP